MEKTSVTLKGRQISLVIRRHRRARRISLHLSPARDGIHMTLPVRASIETGMKFLFSREEWVLANIEENSAMGFHDGAVIPILGQECVIRHMPGRGVAQLTAASHLLVYGAAEFMPRRVRDFLKKTAQEACDARARKMAAAVGKKIKSVKPRDSKSRWGSCSHDGNLNFNWRIVLAPIAVLDYLVAHEVAHLVEMSHGKKFWEVVEQLCPDYKAQRAWLRKEGHVLHRYQ